MRTFAQYTFSLLCCFARPLSFAGCLDRIVPRFLSTVGGLLVTGFVALFSVPVAADVLASNIDQTESNTHTTVDRAQSFTSGSVTSTVSSVDVRFRSNSGTSVTVKLASGTPNNFIDVATMTNPATFSSGILSFTTPENTTITLLADTQYWVLVQNQGGVGLTDSHNDDAATKSGWSVTDGSYFWSTSGSAWRPSSAKNVMIRINGTETESTNSQATGAPTISGFPQVGQTLTAATTGISDSDGLTSPTYSYQWIRVDGTNETNIASATASTYVLAAADSGKTIKVKVSFQDDDMNDEELTSSATGTVVAKAPACSSGNAWCATLTVGASTKATGKSNGFCKSLTGICDTTYGSLSDSDFILDSTTYNVNSIRWGAGSGGTKLHLTLGSALSAIEVNRLTLNVDSDALALSDATEGKKQGTLANNYNWTAPTTVRGYAVGRKVTVELMRAALPTITISTSDTSVTEGTSVDFTVTSNPAPSANLRVSLTVADVSGSDFLATAAEGTQTVTINATETTATHTVATQSDTTHEANGSITVTVATNDAYTVGDNNSASVTVNDDDNATPTGSVTIDGTVKQGQILTANTNDVADGDGLGDFSYQWIRGSTNITGATSSTYTLVSADVGETIKVKVSWTDDGGTDESLTSDATAEVAHINGSVSITGTPTQGQTLSADTSNVADPDGPTNLTFTYQWIRGSTNISGATSSTYQLVQADVGQAIKVTVSWTDSGNNAESLTSDATSTVANVNDPPSGSVSITGSATKGETLTADTSGISDPDGPASLTFSYQWIRSSTDITGATSSTYTLVQADVGQTIKVKVSWTDAGNTAESSTSAATATVADVDETSPTISSVKISSTPSADTNSDNTADTYVIGDTITIDFTFNEPVQYGGSDISRIRMRLDLGADDTNYNNSGKVLRSPTISGSRLRFSYTVVAGDLDADGIWIQTNSATSEIVLFGPDLHLLTDSSNNAVRKTFSGLATTGDTKHKVDGVRPAFSSATVNGSALEVTFSKTLDSSGATKPASSVFTVTATKNSTDRTVNGSSTAVTINGKVVSATLASAVAHDETVKVDYSAPSANPLEDLVGNDVSDFDDEDVTNDTPSPSNPSITISGGAAVTEGTAAQFTVTASPAPAANLTVNLSVSDASGSDFVASGNEGNKTVTINANTTSATYSVTTQSDTTDEPNGDVTVTVKTGTGYTVGSTSSAMVTVNDDDDPAVTITGGSAVTEGTAAQFTVTIATAPSSNLTVNLTVSDASGSDFLASGDEGSKTVTIQANQTTATYSVTTQSDTTDEASGSITVALATGTGYALGTPNSATVTVNDDDEPSVSISGGSAVTEGTAAEFTVTITTAPSANLTVNLTVSDLSGSDFIASTDEGSKSVTIMANNTTATYSVTTQSDSTDEASGSITVELATGSGYQIGTPNSATVTVNDDDDPVVTISGGSAVTEGTAAEFTVTITTAPTSDLTVNLSVSEAAGSDFVASGDEGNKTVTIKANKTTATYSVTTQADTTDEPNSSVTVTVATGTGYTVGSANSASVTVNDDDDVGPAITITAGTSPVTEGTAAEFTITASEAPMADLTVNLTVADVTGSDFVASGDEGSKTVTITNGTTSASYSVTTQSDTVDEASGSVTVTVAAGTGYNVGSSNSASVTVNDDDLPAITISGGDAVTEGTAAEFTVTASTASTTNLTVNLTVADASNSDFIASGNEGSKTVSISANSKSATYSVATTADSTDEPNGSISVTVGTGTGYTVGSPSSATVTVNDDDATANRSPVFTNQASTASVNENSAADTTVVTITATDPEGDTITYSLDSTSDAKFDIDSGDGEITVQADDSLDHEANATITATVTATDSNNNASSHDVVITINDQNEPPDAPGAPSVSATSGSTTSIDVSWTAPSTTGKPDINDYDVQYKKSSETNWTAHSFTGTGTSTSIASLDANTTYNVQVMAKNPEGDSSWSPTGSAMTSNTTPTFSSQPTTATINENSAAGTTVVTVLATDPDSGDTVTHTLDSTSDDLFNIDGSTGKITVKANDSLDHEARSSITATVTATDSQNANATHNVAITIADQNEPPAAPDAPSVSGASTTSISVSWTAPTNTGKPDINDYDVQFKESSVSSWTAHAFTGTGTSTTISNLSAAVSYDVQIMAKNPEGDSAWSATGKGTTNNTAPTFSSPPTSLSIAENSADGTDVGTVAATDADGHTLTYSLDTTTAGSFVIDSDGLIEVKSGADLDHESKSSFSATVTVNDGTVDVTHDVTINVTDELEPPGVPTSVTVSATDKSTTSIDVSWTAPSTSGIPAISDYDLQHRVSGVEAWTDSSIDTTSTSASIASLLAGTTYEVQVRAHNAEGTSDWSSTGSGDTSNTAPTFSSPPTSLSINENSAGGTSVGTVAATDADGHTLTYSLDTTTAGSFSINSSGAITVKSGATLDHEAKSSFSTTVTVSDGRSDGEVTHSLTINIADVDEPPAAPGAPTVTATSGSTTSIDVSWTAPSTTGKPAISDYDVQYRVSGEDDWIDAEYDGTTASTAIGSLLAGTTYEVQVKAHNNEGASGWSLTGSGDTNNTPPTFTTPPSSLSVNENSAGNTNVGTVAATDADGHTLTYSLDTTTDGSFNISSSGVITVQSGADLNHEAKSSFSTTVTVADGRSDGTVSHSLTINIADVLEPPGTPPGTPSVTGASTTSVTVSWTAPNMTGKPPISDYDIQQRVQGTTAWTDAGVDTTNTTATISSLLPGTTYEVQVQAHNDEGTSNWSATGSGDTLNTAPVFTSTPASLTINENSASGTSAGTVGATDADGHSLTYSLNTAADAVFDVSSNGTITLQSGANLDYEATTSYSTTVTVSDGRSDGIVSHGFTINVGDLDEPPDAPATPTVAADSDTSVTVTWTAPDVDGKPPLTDYDVRFYRGSSDPANDSAWVYEGESGGHTHTGTATSTTITGLFAGYPYRVQVSAKNDEGTSPWSASGSGTTNTAGNAAPLFSSPPSSVEIAENSVGGTTVATVTATDGDGDSLTYSLDSTSDATFDISGSGVITVQSDATVDHEATPSITVTVIANDGTVNSTHDLTVNITDVDEPPNTPAAPTLDIATGVGVTVTWTAPASTGQPPLTDYDVRYYQGSADPEDEADWIEPDDAGGHDHVGTQTSADITGLAADTAYRIQIRAHNEEGSSGWSASGDAATIELATPMISRIVIVSTPPADQNNTYMPGDTVRARVTFSNPVDVVGSPTLTMQLDSADETRSMLHDDSTEQTNTTVLEFTYDVAEGDLSTLGIAFPADAVTLPEGASIRAAGSSSVNAVLDSDAVDPDANHRVDGVPPMLVEDNPIRISSSAGTDEVYAIGDHIEFTAEFTEAVTISGANGEPSDNGAIRIAYSTGVGPRVAFQLGDETKYAIYHRTEGNLVIFRYTISEEDTDADSIVIAEDALQLNGGAIADTQGNTSDETELENEPIVVSTGHEVDATPPTFVSATVKGTTLRVEFSESLNASNTMKPPSSVFIVTVLEEDNATRAIDGTDDPVRINGELVTATLVAEVMHGENVNVSYVLPSNNAFTDVPGNTAAAFGNRVARNTTSSSGMNTAPQFSDPPSSIELLENSAPGTTVVTVSATDADGDTLAYSLDSVADEVFNVDGSGIIWVQRGARIDYETTSSYAVILTVDDGSEEITHGFTINVINEDEPPLPPGAPEIRSATATSLTVSWTAPDATGKPPITDYDVRYRLAETTTWSDADFDSVETSTTLEGLVENDRYDVQVRAINAEGASSWSATGTGTVLDPSKNAPPNFASPPESLEVAENSDGGTLVGTVSAGDPEGDTLSYKLDEESADSFSIDNRGRITVNEGAVLDHEATPTFTITVTVTDEINDVSHDILIKLIDENEPPGTTSTPVVSVLSDLSLMVSWTVSDDVGKPPIVAFDIQIREEGTTEWVDAQFEVEDTSAVVTGLNASTTYEVRVRATNDEGDSDWSQSASGTTNKENRAPAFDSPPSSLSVAENIASGSEIGSVTATDAESDPLTYSLDSSSDEVFDIDGNGVIVLGSETTLDFETKSRYALTVTVTDGRAVATHSLAIQVTDVNEAPGKPLPPVLSTPSVSPRSSLAASWQAPPNSGPAIFDYDLEYRDAGSSVWTDAVFIGIGTNTTITGLASGTTYEVRVRATNEEGTGAWSDAASHQVAGLTTADTSPITKAWLARFGRTVTDEVNNAIAMRRESPTAGQNDVAVAGHSVSSFLPGRDHFSGHYNGRFSEVNASRALASEGIDAHDGFFDALETGQYSSSESSPFHPNTLSDTSFNLSVNPTGSGRGSTAIWGKGGVSNFDGRDDELSLSGTVKTGFLAADYSSNGLSSSGPRRWQLGVAIGHAQGTGDFDNPDTSGNIETRLTGLFPYGSVWVNERLSLWTTLGVGSGELTLAPDGFAPLTTDVSMSTGSFGVRRDVTQRTADTGIVIAVKSDARFTQTSSEAASNGGISLASVDAETWLARLGFEGSRSIAFADGSTLTPLLEIALRFDGGDAETGYGADVGGGFSFTDSSRKARVDLRGRGLLTHDAADFKEWGMSASFMWDPQPQNDSGFSFSLTQSLGASPTVGMDALWSRETFAQLGMDGRRDRSTRIDQDFAIDRVLEGEISYAMPVFKLGVQSSPYVGFGISEIGRDWRVGWRLISGGTRRGDMVFDLDAVHREFHRRGVPIEVGVMLRASVLL